MNAGNNAEDFRSLAGNGCDLVGVEQVSANGSSYWVGRYRCKDGWASARLLVRLSALNAGAPQERAIALELAQAYGPNQERIARAIHSYVKARVRFVRERRETFQSAIYTLRSGFGDCDDSSRVVYVLAVAAGLRARMKFLAKDGQPRHVVAQVFVAGKWRWCETTVAANFDEAPLVAVRRLGIKNRHDIGGADNMNGVTLTSDTLGIDCCNTYAFRVVVHRSLLGLWAQSPEAQIAEVFADQGFEAITVYTDPAKLPPEVPADFRDLTGASFPDFTAWIKADWRLPESKAIDRDQGGPVPLTVLDARPWPLPAGSPVSPPPPVFPLQYTTRLSQVFLPPPGSTLGIRGVGLRLKCSPLMLMQALWHESGLDPAASNPRNAVDGTIAANGINQAMSDRPGVRSILQGMGWKGAASDYRKLSAEDQLPYVENFYRPWAHLGMSSVGMIYALTYLPGRVAERGTAPETVLTRKGDVDGHHKNGSPFSFYDGNESLDFDKSGEITIGGLEKVAMRSWLNNDRNFTRELECRVANGGGCAPGSNLPDLIAKNGGLVGAGVFAVASAVALAYAWWTT